VQTAAAIAYNLDKRQEDARNMVVYDMSSTFRATLLTCDDGVVEVSRPYLAEKIYEFFLPSQLPHKIVNLLFAITSQNMKLTVLWGIRLSKTVC